VLSLKLRTNVNERIVNYMELNVIYKSTLKDMSIIFIKEIIRFMRREFVDDNFEVVSTSSSITSK
jgi:hypothetical protein